jgi:hypothetical protein
MCCILNFSAQQLSNRTARSPWAHSIAHFTKTPAPFFSAMVLKLVGYTEVHFLPIEPCGGTIVEHIRENLMLNNTTEVRGPYLHSAPDTTSISGQFGLVHLVDLGMIPGLEQITGRFSRFTDIVAIGPSIDQIIQSLKGLEYTPFVEREIGDRRVAVMRRTRLPVARGLVEV